MRRALIALSLLALCCWEPAWADPLDWNHGDWKTWTASGETAPGELDGGLVVDLGALRATRGPVYWPFYASGSSPLGVDLAGEGDLVVSMAGAGADLAGGELRFYVSEGGGTYHFHPEAVAADGETALALGEDWGAPLGVLAAPVSYGFQLVGASGQPAGSIVLQALSWEAAGPGQPGPPEPDPRAGRRRGRDRAGVDRGIRAGGLLPAGGERLGWTVGVRPHGCGVPGGVRSRRGALRLEGAGRGRFRGGRRVVRAELPGGRLRGAVRWAGGVPRAAALPGVSGLRFVLPGAAGARTRRPAGRLLAARDPERRELGGRLPLDPQCARYGAAHPRPRSSSEGRGLSCF